MLLEPIILSNSSNVLRIVAKDLSIPEGTDYMQVGCISLPIDYFKNILETQYGQIFTQWITLFDDLDDDEYDGDLGENDEEHPMIRTHIAVSAYNPNPVTPKVTKQVSSTSANKPTTASVTPRNLKINTAAVVALQNAALKSRTSVTPNKLEAMGSPTAMSAIKNMQRRKTIVTESGTKKVVMADIEPEVQEHKEPSIKNRRAQKKA